ncbi:BglG family transcription antiterminator [Thermoactinomyces mirandus]|uniref:BglG family transcription antiterminator n=1 Tax=Thermoactinomyces mirandus TaxID=2756294 RepID=A0A7W2ATR0_9BACL|nr:BglG family transcription antiterminator [Thermoactinomyces mirandus]MBA4603801.1 BglG family transcription antiterminator [Thermoactinomyces mirandus]
MYITARERLILETLLSATEKVTVQNLAKELDVSVRTIHRDLKEIERLLKDFRLRLLKKPGVGIRLAGEQERIEELISVLFQQSHQDFTPGERQTMILCSLLEAKDPVKLVALANDLHVTMATISNDLTKLEDELKKFDLSLVRKRGYGVEIIGSESAKRKAMRIAENVDEVQFLSLIRENIQNKTRRATELVSERLLGLIEKKKLLLVEKVVDEMNRKLPYSLADSAYIGLVVHLTLAIERIMQGENIEIDPTYLRGLQNSYEYEMAKKVADQLATVFHVDIPKAEIGYITMHLQGAKLRQDREYPIEEERYPLAIKAKKLIHYVEKELNCKLLNQASLFQGLLTHLKPALYRIQRNMGISNPMLAKIKEDYGQLFDVVKKGTEAIFKNVSVPDEEIGYLVMHFGSALLRDQYSKGLKALIICSSGIGTSKMLATRIRQEIPEIKKLTILSAFQLHQVNPDEFDLIISTIPLPNLQADYLVASPMLSKEEAEKIRTYIQEKIKDYSPHKPFKGQKRVPSRKTGQTLENLQKIQRYTEAMIQVLEGFHVSLSKDVETIREGLEEACFHLWNRGVIREQEKVLHALLEREHHGGLGIPDTRLALFHTRSDQVIRPSFTVYRLKKPLPVKAMDQSEIKAASLMLLLAPLDYSRQGLEVLSYISSILIENEESISLFESGNARSIYAYLSARFESFFHEKISELRSV